MKTEKAALWEDNPKITYTSYLMDNSSDIKEGRKHPAVIVCGGGAYMGISEREKEPVALCFLAKGYQAFVLDYTTKENGEPFYPTPVYDLAKMILIVREYADEWNISPDKICAIGFSAGGHLVSCLSTQWQESYLQKKLNVTPEKMKPNAVILSYPIVDYLCQRECLEKDNDKNKQSGSVPVPKSEINHMFEEISIGDNPTEDMLRNASPYYHITKNTSPTFIWQTATDELVYMEQNLMYAKRLKEFNVPVELHIFQDSVHGMSLATKASGGGEKFIDQDVSGWFDLSIRFLERNM
jgi:acetyl esterase/lipase